jgi:hypothetical protein
MNLDMVKQCTKYQINIWKHERTKCEQSAEKENSGYFSKSKDHNLVKDQGSKPNSKLICILVW